MLKLLSLCCVWINSESCKIPGTPLLTGARPVAKSLCGPAFNDFAAKIRKIDRKLISLWKMLISSRKVSFGWSIYEAIQSLIQITRSTF